jgi:hypothetical protein
MIPGATTPHPPTEAEISGAAGKYELLIYLTRKKKRFEIFMLVGSSQQIDVVGGHSKLWCHSLTTLEASFKSVICL